MFKILQKDGVLVIVCHRNPLDNEINVFYSSGKILLSSEYFVLDAALALALPTKLGQNLIIRKRPKVSTTPQLLWKSYDADGSLWYECIFDLKSLQANKSCPITEMLSKILKQARLQKPSFLQCEDDDVLVETHLTFPRNWGLGSSSTLINNIANWAGISAFDLFFSIFNGSGYDIACAQSNAPILYELKDKKPSWKAVNFDPSFKDSLYFIYLGHKVQSEKAIQNYQKMSITDDSIVDDLSLLTKEMLLTQDLKDFENIIQKHESIVGKALKQPLAKDLYFQDYWGAVKSLGAWGGDFVLATSSKSFKETKKYFSNLGYNVLIPYRDFVLRSDHDPSD